MAKSPSADMAELFVVHDVASSAIRTNHGKTLNAELGDDVGVSDTTFNYASLREGLHSAELVFLRTGLFRRYTGDSNCRHSLPHVRHFSQG